MQRKALAKLYSWKDLTRLAIRDLQAKTGLHDDEAEFHYVGGLDCAGNPFIRVDLAPMEQTTKK